MSTAQPPKQARELRGLSQRALGIRLGLGPEKGSSRINRYEHQVTAVGFDNLERLAAERGSPGGLPACRERRDGPNTILTMSQAKTGRQKKLAQALALLATNARLLETCMAIAKLPKTEQAKAIGELLKPAKKAPAKRGRTAGATRRK